MKNNELEYHLSNEEEKDRVASINDLISYIKENGIKKNYLSGLYNDYYYKGFYEFFINKNIKEAKQCFYLAGRFLEMYINLYNETISGLSPFILGAFLSDNIILIKRICRFEDDININNNFPMVIQAIVRNDYNEAKKIINNFKLKLFDTDKTFFIALMNEDIKVMEDMIVKMVSKEHKKRVNRGWIYENTFSEHALFYVKLAYIKGYKLDINHPLIPMELVEVNPNDEYWEYDFMKNKGIKNV